MPIGIDDLLILVNLEGKLGWKFLPKSIKKGIEKLLKKQDAFWKRQMLQQNALVHFDPSAALGLTTDPRRPMEGPPTSRKKIFKNRQEDKI